MSIPREILRKYKNNITSNVKSMKINLQASGFDGRAVVNSVGGWASGKLWKSGYRWSFNGWIWSWRDSYDFDNYYGGLSWRNISTWLGKTWDLSSLITGRSLRITIFTFMVPGGIVSLVKANVTRCKFLYNLT